MSYIFSFYNFVASLQKRLPLQIHKSIELIRKQKYYYNSNTLTYEKAKSSWRWKLVKTLAYLGSILFFGILTSLLFFKYFETPKEKLVERDLLQMELEYEKMSTRVSTMEGILDDLAKRDENIYRVIFEAEPISEEVRKSGIGGGNRYADLLNMPQGKIIRNTKLKIDQLEKQIAIQSKSYEELKRLLNEKEEMLASIPAIQPILTTDNIYLSSGFGKRYHPIYKTRRMHTGIDFSAPTGTDIRASGNGVIEKVKKQRTGYGYHVVINHDFGYKTLYGHMSEVSVRKGQKVKRGEVIGKVGNTGTSTAPHLHYEVIQNDRKINPVHFFFDDLTPEEYDAVIEQAELGNQSFD